MNGQRTSKRRQRRNARIQRRAARRPIPTYSTVRENPTHFTRAMAAIRRQVVNELFPRVTRPQQELITQKLSLPWKWYSSPEKFFEDQPKESFFGKYWNTYQALRNPPIMDAKKRVEWKQMRRILVQFLNPQLGYIGELPQKGKRVVVVLVARDMTPIMISKRIRDFLLENPEELWREMGELNSL